MASPFASAAATCSAGVEARSRSPCPDRSLAAMGPDWSPLAALSAAPDFSVTWRASPKSLMRTVVAPDEHVVGLEVPVHESLRVRRRQPAPRRDEHLQASCQLRGRGVLPVRHGVPLDELHRDEHPLARSPDVVDDDDVGVESRAIAWASRTSLRPSGRLDRRCRFTRSRLTATLRPNSGSYAA